MIPKIVILKSLDVYRDGGSLSASFESKDKIEYSLFFKIYRKDEKTKARTYHIPVLKKYVNNDTTSKITGVTSLDWKKETITISWKETILLLKKLKSYMKNFQSEYIWVLKEMEEIASNDGTI